MRRFILALALVLPLMAAPKARLPKPSRQEIIQSCCIKVTVEERAALQATKTRLEAAEVIQSIYQDRYAFWCAQYEAIKRLPPGTDIDRAEVIEMKQIFETAVNNIDGLVEKLHSVDKK